VWSECRTGDELADFARGEDGASFRYGIVNLGADSPAERAERIDAIGARLGYEFEAL
jgi:hypothetical protein